MILTWKQPAWFFPRSGFYQSICGLLFFFLLSVTHFIILYFVSITFYKNQRTKRFITKKKFFYFYLNV